LWILDSLPILESREKHEENNIIKILFNKKFWEVCTGEPFFKRVPGRRRHRLTVDAGQISPVDLFAEFGYI
jgi:hypothetical protein